MKKLILVALIFFTIKTDAHKEWVHQYIVNQAYLLLNNTIPNITPMFDSFFRDANGNLYPIGEPSNHSITSVIGGAWTEDHSDIVYGHCGLPFPLPFSGCPLSSTTHFWNPDGDVYANNNLEFASGSFENAFEKAEALWNGDITITLPGPFYFPSGTTEYNAIDNGGISPNQTFTYLKIKYSRLTDMIKNRKYWIIGVVTVNQSIDFSEPVEISNSSNYLDYFFSMNILGRICHLLADMNVPGHVRIKSHPCDVGKGERYEMEIAGKNWFAIAESCNDINPNFQAQSITYQNALNQGGVIPIWTKKDALKTLFYTNAQLTDVYNCYRANLDLTHESFNGNRNYHSIDPFTNDDYSELNSIVGSIPTTFNSWDQELNNMLNTSFVYTIRSTAALLLKFGMETNLIPNTLIMNSFNGGNIKLNGSTYYSGHCLPSSNNPSSVTIQAIDQLYDNCYWRFQNWQKIVNGSIVQTINTRSITITPTAHTTYKANFTSENYFFWNVTGPLKGLYRGESRVFHINANYGNPSANYYWHTEYRHIQNGQVYWSTGLPEGCSISFSSSGNSATFANNYFSKYCGGWADSVIRVHGTVQPAACGCSNQSFFEEITLKNRTRPGYPPPPPPGGCPYIYTWIGNEWIEDNNILPQSQDPSLLGQNVTDYYQLFNKPVEEDGKYYLAISEYEEDRSFFDQFKLLIIDHPQETFITVDDSGSVIQFAKPAFFANAQLDSNDVYKLLYSLDDIKTEVSPSDTLSLSFENVNSGTEQWLLLVGQVQAVAKEKVSGKIVKSDINGKENSASFTSFRLRKNPTFQWIVAPVSNTNTLQIDIAWQEEAEVDYTELSNKIDFPFTLSEAELLNAVHSVAGDIISEVIVNDGITSELNKNDWIELSFSIPPQTDGTQRSFIFVSNGRYERLSNKSSNNLSGKNQLLKSGADLSLPLEYKLAQNYPNPFNPSATINYSIKDAGNVRLKVYDIIGNEVGELVNQNLSPGNYSVEFNANDLPSGVYIYTIQVNNFFDSKKMILLK